jgi:hypothetical protein
MYNFKEYLRSTLREAFGDFGTKGSGRANINYMSGKGHQTQMAIPSPGGDMDDLRTLCREMERTWDDWGEGTHPDRLCEQMNYYYQQLCNSGWTYFCGQSCVNQSDHKDWKSFCKKYGMVDL